MNNYDNCRVLLSIKDNEVCKSIEQLERAVKPYPVCLKESNYWKLITVEVLTKFDLVITSHKGLHGRVG